LTKLKVFKVETSACGANATALAVANNFLLGQNTTMNSWHGRRKPPSRASVWPRQRQNHVTDGLLKLFRAGNVARNCDTTVERYGTAEKLTCA